jgi:uncharacterized protein
MSTLKQGLRNYYLLQALFKTTLNILYLNFSEYIDTNKPKGFNREDVEPPYLKKGKWLIQSLALDISGTCNFSCKYCAEGATQPKRFPMNMETVKAALNFIFPQEKMNCNTTLRFGSGEPLLAFPLLKEIEKQLNFLSKKNKPFINDLFITSNGYLLNDEILNWLISSNCHFKISFDGPKTYQDFWRITNNHQGTYDKIKPIIQTCAKKMHGRFSITAVLCKGSDPNKVFREVANLGVERIELVPVVSHNSSIYPDYEDIKKYYKFVQNYAHSIYNKTKDAHIPELTRFTDCVRRVMGYNNLRIPCGAGRNFFGVGSDGILYPCFRFIGIKKYALGTVYSGIESNAYASFLSGTGRPYEERNSCQDCWAAPLCGGPCFSCSELFGPGNGEPVNIHCLYIMADAKAAIWLVNKLKRNDPQRLLSFLPEYARVI